MTRRRAVFFDRDGTLIQTAVIEGRPIAENDPSTVVIIQGATQLCKTLIDHEIRVFLITNQPDVARGKVAYEHVREVNEIVRQRCSLTDVAVCIHDDSDDCSCRKPKPGMILDLATQYEIDLERSVVVGDRWRDVETGVNAGCETLLIDYGYDEPCRVQPTWKVESLREAAVVLCHHFGIY